MKKILLLFIISIGFTLNAQGLLSEDCSFLSLGDVGTDLTGATEGQTGWRVKALAGTLLSDMSVIDIGGEYGNAFQLTGSSVSTTATKIIYNTTIADSWATRTINNEIAEVTFDFFTGPVSTSKNSQRVALYNSTGVVIGGILVVMDTKEVKGIARYDNAGTVGNYVFGLGTSATTPIILESNTWYKLGFSFNKTTGEIKWKEGTGLFNRFVIGVSTGIDVAHLDLLATSILFSGEVNSVSSVGVFDNITATATSTDTLLAIEKITDSNSNFSVYPNPVTNLISVSSKNNAAITAVSLTDLKGRIIKNQSFDTVATIEMNVTDLASGMYLMTIVSNEGTATKKIVKN